MAHFAPFALRSALASMPTSIDDYIAGHPVAVQKRLKQIRATIRRAAPGAEEKISYRIPSYVLGGHLIFFAAFKGHIGIYPITAGMAKYRREMRPYVGKTAKRSIRIAHDQPLPLPLLAKLVRVRVQENNQRAALSAKATVKAKNR